MTAQKILEMFEQDRFAHFLVGQTERSHDAAQQLVGLQLRGDQLRGDDMARIELLKKILHQGGFARPDAAGDDDEALALAQPVAQIGQRPRVNATAEEKPRIGAQLERLGAETVIIDIHLGFKISY